MIQPLCHVVRHKPEAGDIPKPNLLINRPPISEWKSEDAALGTSLAIARYELPPTPKASKQKDHKMFQTFLHIKDLKVISSTVFFKQWVKPSKNGSQASFQEGCYI